MATLNGIAAYYENRENYHHFMENGTLYTTLDTATTRNILTTVFVVLNLAIGMVGAYFLKARNLHKLGTKSETDRKVPLNHLTSWISLTGMIKYSWDTFQLPGGKYGVLMLVTGAFGLAHQYFVNSFILPVSMQDSCTFEFGMSTTANTGGRIVPSSTYSPATTVYNAQYQVWMNGGSFGIYEKVNYTTATFKPTADDLLGWWLCDYEVDTISSTDWQNSDSISSFLQTQNFLYTEASAMTVSPQSPAADDPVFGFLAWSADQTDDSNIQWNIKASVATHLSAYSTTAPVVNLYCSLAVVDNATWTPPIMPSEQTLNEWVNATYGVLMNVPAIDYYQFYIRWMLNSMVMVAGSANVDTWYASQLPKGASTTFGCSVQGTKILPEIWAILGAVLLIFVPLSLADIYLFLYWYFQPKGRDRPHLVDAAPSSVQEWQLALLREMIDDKIVARDMRYYSYRKSADSDKYVIVNNKNATAVSAVSAVSQDEP